MPKPLFPEGNAATHPCFHPQAGGRVVKVNTVVVFGVNEAHVLEIAETVSRLKADLHNLIALIPVSGTAFCDTVPPSPGLMESLRDAAESFLPQMRHSARCRSDAAGLLHDDRSKEIRCPANGAGWIGHRQPTLEPIGLRTRQLGPKAAKECTSKCR
jgi:MoaA/NifB/PqqE/SkfB family radical SAM enzyme